MPASHRRTRTPIRKIWARGPWRATVALTAVAAVVTTAALSSASASTSGQTTTGTGQSFAINITSPAAGAPALPVGTTSVPVAGTISIGNVPVTGEAHVVFVIDQSGSLGQTNFNTEKQSAIGLFNQIRNTSGLSVNTSLIFFATQTQVVLNDQPAADNFVDAVNTHPYVGGSTFTKDAITAATNQLTGKNGIKQIILITDGAPNPANSQTPTSAQRAQLDAMGAAVYVYSVGPDGVCPPLAVIATKCTLVPQFTSLPSTVSGTPPAGIQSVDLSVNGGAFQPATVNNLGQVSGTATGLQPGSNTVVLRGTATDGTTVSADVTVNVTAADTTPPDTSITAGPSGTVGTGSASFTYAGLPASDTDHFVCKLDGATVTCANSGRSFTGLSDGSHTFTVAAVDAAGNTDATPASRTWTVDTTAPDTSITSGPSGTITSGSANFTYAGQPASDTDHFACTLDGSDVSCANSGRSFTGLGDGSHTFTAAAVDGAGNTDPTPASRTWVVDTTGPDTSITSGPSGTVASGSASFTYAGQPASDTDHFVCTLDGAGVSCANAGRSFTGLGDGSHTFTVAAVDALGNTDATPASRTWTVDTTAPDTTITGGPAGTVASGSASFTYTGQPAGDTDHFVCTLDGAGVSCANAGRSFTGLGDGSHTFTVAAVDGVGNTDATPASRTWTVDTTAPDTSITSGPSGTIATGSASFSYAGMPANDTDHFVCTLDGSDVPCANDGRSFSGLGDGSHTFTVAAVDAVGNTDASPASRSWTVDATAPDTTITSGPSGTVASAAASFTYAGQPASDTDHFVCTLDGSDVSCANGGRSFTGLGDGSHTFTVAAVDALGNTDATPASRTWTVDTTAPDTSITAGPSGTVASASASFAYVGDPVSDTDHFVCTLDGSDVPCANAGRSFTGLADGSHTFTVAAVDAVGNTDATPASRTWTVDTTAPDTSISSGPSGTIASGSASFTYAGMPANDTDHFVCTLDGSAATCASDGVSFTGLGDGSHTFVIAAVDAVGNTDPTPASRTWTVDTTPPDTVLTTGPSGTVASAAASFTYAGQPAGDTDHFVCTLDGANVSCANGGRSFSGLGDGSHTFTVAAVDAVGNTDQSPASRTWIVDTTPPDTVITAGPSGTVASAAASFAYAGDPATDTDHFVCTLDGSSVACADGGRSFTGLGDGSHTFTVAAVDAVGNADPTPASRTWTVDTTPPDTLIGSGPSGTVATGSASFTYSGIPASDTDHFVCTLDGSAVACANGGRSFTGLGDGSHTFTAAAVDAVGNTDPSPAARTWTVDTTPPDTAITAGPSGTVANGSASFSYVGVPASDTDHFVCRLDGAAVACGTGSTSLTGLAAGSHTFTVAAVDAVGNTDPTPASRTWLVDSPPVAALAATPLTVETGQAVTFSTTGTTDPDGASDLATWTLAYGDGATASGTGAPPASLTHAYATAGTYIATLTVTDSFGLTNAAGVVVTVKKAATTLVVNPDIATVSTTALLTSTGLAALVTGKVTLHPSATLTRTRDGAPVVGRTVSFTTSNGTAICSAVTDAQGYAGCGGLLTVAPITLGLGYNGSFAGDASYAASNGSGGLTFVYIRIL